MIEPIAPDYSNTPICANRPRTNFPLSELSGKPRIQVTVFATGDENALAETIESLRRQSFRAWSLVIVGESRPSALQLDIQYELRAQFTKNSGAEYNLLLLAGTMLETCALEKMLWSLEGNPSREFCISAYVTFGAKCSLSRLSTDFRHNPFSAPALISGTLFRKNVELPAGLDADKISCAEKSSEFYLALSSRGQFGVGLAEYLLWHRTSALGEFPEHTLMALSECYSNSPEPALGQCAANCIEAPFQNTLVKSAPHLLMFVCPLEIGGSTKFNRDLTEHLASKGWTSSIIVTTPQKQSWLPVFAKYTPDIFLLDRYMEMSDYYRFSCYLIESRQPDLVLITHSTFGYDILPLLKLKYPKLKFVDYTHVHREHFGEGGYAAISVSWQHLLDLNIVSSQQLKQYMVSHGADEQKIEVCYTNIDTDKVKPDADVRRVVRQDLGLSQTVPLILFAGRFEEQKQPPVLLKTLNKLCHEHQANFIALLAGSGDYKEWMLEYVTEYNLFQNVWFLGTLSNQETLRIMKACDIFFLPSKWEGISLAFYEAMASGLTIVGSNVGGQRELVTADCGVLVDTGDEEAEVSEYAKHLLSLLSDPGKRIRMQQNSRLRVENNFHISQMGSRMIGLFTKVIALSQSTVKISVPEEELKTYYSKIIEGEIEGIAGQQAINVAQKIGLEFKQAKDHAEQLQLQYETLKNDLDRLRNGLRGSAGTA